MNDIKELLEKVHNLLDYLNGKYGDEKELCLNCHSKQTDASGIVHHPECIILQIRQYLAGYLKPSPVFKVIGDEEIDGDTSFTQWYEYFTTTLGRKPSDAERNLILFMKKATAQAQAQADQSTHAGLMKEKDAENKELLNALKSVKTWLCADGEITDDGTWNKQFVKANNLVNKLLSRYER